MGEEISNLLPPHANHPYIHLNCFIFTTNTKTIKAAIMYLLKLILQLVCFLNCSLRFFLLAEANNNDISSVQYLKHTCSTHNKTFPPNNNSAYRSNLHTLLTTLHAHATTAEFYSTTAPGGGAGETIYGMFMCRGDVTKRTCQNCTGIATREIGWRCPNSKEAIIWYHECLVRYSNRYLLSKVEEWPRHKFMNYSVTTNSTKQGSYGWLLANTLSDAVGEAANAGAVGTKKFATKHASLGLGGSHSLHNNNRNDDDEVYTPVQCTPDLTRQDCRRCLGDIMKDIPLCCLGRDCGMVLYPSCTLMFGIDQFYRDVDRTQPPSTNKHIQPSKEQIAISSLKIIIPAVILMTILAVFFANHVRRIKALRRYKAILEENFGDESTSLESLQFDLATLEAATNKFSLENMVGEGGFGKVYKGTLSNGLEVAIKRLSSCSSQGAIEFKNEVLSIARLQHRNLVTLLGFCLQENEKMLVYEFVPNKSLDYFLFDPQNERLLNWSERYNIVVGIARAILYLHQYSRLKIIHRDIKPSNILLDNHMSPKISDFGMAKMVALDQDQGRTRRIVGTYGYMSPEYAMLGNFSEKSDVFSFGVMILEIISGKKNSRSYKSYFVDGLLSYAWRQWKDGTPIEILDTKLRDSCSQNEVIKCIQIGLLCVQENPVDRPHMATVVSYLSNISIELPIPHEPAFYIDDDKVEPNLVEVDLDFGSVRYSSVNEMSISRSFPR